MAAYAALVSLMNDLELIPNHPTHSFSFENKHITSLTQIVHFLVDFMESYDSHGCGREAAEILESRIASAAHAAHDVIESHLVDQILAGSTLHATYDVIKYHGVVQHCAASTLHSDIRSYFLDFVRRKAKRFGSILRRKPRSYLLPDLQKAIDDMDFVMGEAMQFQAQNGIKAEQPTYSPPASSEPLSSGKILMVGFDAVVVQLREMLTREPSTRRVIPIVGMGGMGKTTLAKNVYNHLHIQQHFDVRLWATISQEYSTEIILTELLFRERRPPAVSSVSLLGQQLRNMLWDRRYLIVLDDMWSVEAWEKIQMFLPDNGNGSCVIVTSRLSNLGAHLSASPFKMNFLDDDKSWQLFCVKAFGEENCPLELEEIGKKIVNRCRGLPLSIVVIGGHLRRSSRAIGYWEKVSNSMNPISSSAEDAQCLNIISLSYDHLPAHLKPCFLYMGIYPEDGWIDASELVKFWVAEGFIKPKKGISLEEVAEDYLKDLIDMNLIFVHERRWNGKAEICVIHDIVRELCLKIGTKEKFLSVLEDDTQAIDKERRIVISRELSPPATSVLQLPPMLRSLMGRGKLFSDNLSADLRLLRLSAKVNNIYPANFERVNLRYLAFSCDRPSLHLPSLIFRSWNMQTLIIHNDDVEISAPFGIWEMPQLRHVEFLGVYLRDPVPGEKSIQLRNLHTLVGVVNLRLTEEVCNRMPNLNKLSLLYDYFPGDCEANSYYCPQNFVRFKKLESLNCCFSVDSRWRDVVLGLRFPSSVEELCLRDSQLGWEELTMMIKSLSRLGSLALDSVQGPEWDLAEVEFPCLKVLRIFRCDDLIYWNANSSHFPILEILHISDVPKLDEIPFDIGGIPTLARIELIGSSASTAASAISIIAEQESLGNDNLQLDVGFWGTKELERFKKIVREQGLETTSTSLSLSLSLS